jgi:hypothetical protein
MVVHLDLSIVSYTLARFEIAFPPFCSRAQLQIRVAPSRPRSAKAACSRLVSARSPPRVSQNHQGGD